MFQTYIASVPYGWCKKVDLDVAYVAMAIHVCCKCLFKMFHLLQTYVASVLSECYICCSGYTYVAGLCSKCFICFRRMLQEVLSCCKCFMSKHRRSLCARYECCKSISGCRIYYNGYTHVLQVSIQNVSFTSDICCKCFYLDVVFVVVAIYMLQAYVPNISSALDVCYRKCFHVASAS
jgi:hypothetical protein